MPEDKNMLTASRDKQLFFGRKFLPDMAQSMIDEADLLISADNPTEQIECHKSGNCKHPSGTRYWQSIYHHLDVSPRPDEAIVNVANTLCSVAVDFFLKNSSRQYHFDKVHEVTSYHNENVLEGVLLKFSVYEDAKMNFEAFVNTNMDVMPPRNRKGILFRQGEFQVGVDLDFKDLVFRNYLNAMNEHSQPVLLYSLAYAKGDDEKDLVMKVAWVDPNGNIAFITKTSITNSSVKKETIEPEIKTPMMKGIWTVMVINDKKYELLVKIHFLVLPSNEPYVDSETVTYEVAQEERQNLRKIFEQDEPNNKFLKLNHARLDSDQVQSPKNEDETSWQKQVVKEFYSLESICHSDYVDGGRNLDDHHRKGLNLRTIPRCEETLWSSLSPDPKSAISRFDNKLMNLV